MQEGWCSTTVISRWPLNLRQINIAVWFQVRIAQQVTLNVLIQVAFLGESQLAIFLNGVRATVWPLIGVDTQVIVEVVPLAEVHGAVWVIALQDFQISLGLWVLEFEYPKHLC